MNSSHLNLVKEILVEEFRQPFPPSMKEKESQARLQLLTRIAISSISPSTEESPDISEKVTEFIKDHAYNYWRACVSHIMFSKLDQEPCQRAIEEDLDKDDSIIVRLMNLDDPDWLTEDELREKFGKAFKRIDANETLRACYNLKRTYKCCRNLKAGYYMLWLIKQTAGCNFNIPSKETFSESTVKAVLSEFMSSEDSTWEHPGKFIELLFYGLNWHDTPIYIQYLEDDYHSKFIHFSLSQLQSIPVDVWPQKKALIRGFLKNFNHKGKIILANQLKSSSDPETEKIGHHISQALQPAPLRTVLPHFYALRELLPNLSHNDIEAIFDRPFVPFRSKRNSTKDDPECTRCLSFDDSRQTFVSGDLIIGALHKHTINSSERRLSPPLLLAYNMKTEKLEWGIPLNPQFSESSDLDHIDFRLVPVGDDIAIDFQGEKNIPIIDSQSGEVKTTITLPYEMSDDDHHFHLPPDGFGYQDIRSKGKWILTGGEITEGKLNPTFEIKAFNGFFERMSTHVGYKDGLYHKYSFVGPSGKSVTLDCYHAYASGEKLYCIEPNPSDKKTCLLTVRTLMTDDQVVSPPEKSLFINGKRAWIEGLCDNGQLILNLHHPIFVDMDRETIIYSDHRNPLYGNEIINTVTGEVWTWDQISKNIWKVSPEKKELMGTLPGWKGTSFLHVDQEDHLYFIS